MGSKAGHQEEVILVRIGHVGGNGVTGRARRRRRHPGNNRNHLQQHNLLNNRKEKENLTNS